MSGDLRAEYGRRAAAPSDIVDHLPRLVALVDETNAAHVIELGVRAGNSTIAWLYGLERTGGTLTSVDVSEPDVGPWPRWRFIHGDDLSDDVIAQMDGADIVFIDTTHEYDQTHAELVAYAPLVRAGGRIVLHDTELVIGGTKPVTDAIEQFVGSTGLSWTNNPACNGLGEIVMP